MQVVEVDLEGERFVKTLLKASRVNLINKKVTLEIKQDKYIIDGQEFDKSDFMYRCLA